VNAINPVEPARLAYSVTTAAKALSVGRSTMYRLINEGKIKTFETPLGRRIRHDELVAFIERCSEAA
jgi:excisionase family DNA binding protein